MIGDSLGNGPSKKLQIISKYMGLASQFIAICVVIMLSLCVVALCITYFDASDVLDFMSSNDMTLVEVQIMLIVYIVQCVLLLMILWFVFKLSGTLREDHTPFNPGSAKNMKIIAYVFIAYAVIVPLTHWVLLWLTGNEQIFSGAFDDIVMMIAAFLFLCLSLIFEHGSCLQREIDDTL